MEKTILLTNTTTVRDSNNKEEDVKETERLRQEYLQLKRILRNMDRRKNNSDVAMVSQKVKQPERQVT